MDSLCGMSKIYLNEDTAVLEELFFPFEMYANLPDIAESSRHQVQCLLTLLLDVVWCFASLCKDFYQFITFFSLLNFQKQ